MFNRKKHALKTLFKTIKSKEIILFIDRNTSYKSLIKRYGGRYEVYEDCPSSYKRIKVYGEENLLIPLKPNLIGIGFIDNSLVQTKVSKLIETLVKEHFPIDFSDTKTLYIFYPADVEINHPPAITNTHSNIHWFKY